MNNATDTTATEAREGASTAIDYCMECPAAFEITEAHREWMRLASQQGAWYWPVCDECADNATDTTAADLLADVPGGATPGRMAILARVLAEHPNARVEVCSDERTGRRYGQAACRRGRAVKLGRRTYHYQVWAVWPEATPENR